MPFSFYRIQAYGRLPMFIVAVLNGHLLRHERNVFREMEFEAEMKKNLPDYRRNSGRLHTHGDYSEPRMYCWPVCLAKIRSAFEMNGIRGGRVTSCMDDILLSRSLAKDKAQRFGELQLRTRRTAYVRFSTDDLRMRRSSLTRA